MDHQGPHDADSRLGMMWCLALLILILLGLAIVMLPYSFDFVPDTRMRAMCSSNLRQISLGLKNYRDSYGIFPPAYTVDANGKLLHSWRTLILPYLDQKTLYDSIDLTKPWDDPANSAVSEQIPGIYRCPSATSPTNRTTYLGVFGKDKCFTGSKGRKLQEITDKHDETIVVIEVPEDQGVPWMAPLDADENLILSFDPKTKWPHPNLRNAIFVNGSSIHLFNTTSPEELRRMLTIAGGD